MLDSKPSAQGGELLKYDVYVQLRGTSQEAEQKKTSSCKKTKAEAQPATSQKKKMKQPTVRGQLRRQATLAAIKSAAKRTRNQAEAPDSCGKPGDPHDLERGLLASRSSHISKKRRRALDAAMSQTHGGPGCSTTDAKVELVD